MTGGSEDYRAPEISDATWKGKVGPFVYEVRKESRWRRLWRPWILQARKLDAEGRTMFVEELRTERRERDAVAALQVIVDSFAGKRP